MALVRARSDRRAGSGQGTTRGEYGFLGRKRPVDSIKRCQNEVSRRKPGDTEATRAVCDFFCDFAGFLILAVRPPLIPWVGIANCGWGGIEPAIQFRFQFCARRHRKALYFGFCIGLSKSCMILGVVLGTGGIS